MKTIKIINNGAYLNDSCDEITVSSDRTVYNLKVVVDDEDTLPNYVSETFSNGFLNVDTVGNDMFVVVNENNAVEGRNGFIRIKHKMDKDVVYQLNFSQSGKVYGIEFENNDNGGDDESIEIFFNTLSDRNSDESETYDVRLVCTNGLEDFLIKKIEEYSDSLMTKRIPYDNAFNISKIDKSTLRIVNYGKISLLDEVVYKVTVCHKNNRNSCKSIIIRYNNPDTSEGFGFGDE